jgi:hypothetical protein
MGFVGLLTFNQVVVGSIPTGLTIEINELRVKVLPQISAAEA